MKRIKKYYKITFKLSSPLSIGCGEGEWTDRDIVRDGRGVPYVPGSALAGAYRSLFSDKTAEKYFGPELTSQRIEQSSKYGKNLLWDSDICVYDAYMVNQAEGIVTKRDIVSLDEYKVAEPKAKADFEILEPGAEFITYIEQNMDIIQQQYVSDEIAFAWQQGKIWLGAKTGRGYGETIGIKVETKTFNLTDQAQLKQWIKFDMYSSRNEDTMWEIMSTSQCLSSMTPENQDYETVRKIYEKEEIILEKKECCVLNLFLTQRGGISIRQYFTDNGKEDNEKADYKQLTVKKRRSDLEQDKETPVIPGTSWAGAFRAQMGRLNPAFKKEQPLAEIFFGSAKKNSKDSHKTRITFSESQIESGKWVTYTRNAIDRFTGGTVERALYTEKTYYNGNTTLKITCDFTQIDSEDRTQFAKVLAASILDLHGGYMAVGGLTAVGHGLFEIEKITIGKKEFIFSGGNMKDLYFHLVQTIAGKENQG